MMWIPVALTPAVTVAGIGGVISKRWAKTVLPAVSAGRRGQQPAGPVPAPTRHLSAPGRLAGWPATTPRWDRRCSRRCCSRMVGGMGLLAAVLRREP